MGGNSLYFEKSVLEYQEEMESGAIDSRSLVSYFLRRIAVYDGILRSLITVNPHALDEAERLDRERQAGRVRGPLHGIPVVLKDNFDTCDMPTTSGALAFKDFVPAQDAETTRRLRQSGAVILGKANLTELANNGMTISSVKGQTLNPYDLTRTPGGSSGGTGAAVAASLAVMGTGTDTMNSIRSPSSACSLVGIRPTRGLVSRRGISPCSDLQDMCGPIARCVSDAAIMLASMQGYDPGDQSTESIKGKALPDYMDALKPDGLNGRRIMLLENIAGSDPDVLEAVESTARQMERLGAVVVRSSVPELFVPDMYRFNDVQMWEQKPCFDRYVAYEEGRLPVRSLQEYVKTGLITPSVEADLKPKSEVVDPLYAPEYLARLEKNRLLRQFMISLLEQERLDAFMYPLQTVLAVKTTEEKGQHGRNGLMATVTGLPAIDFPGGFSKPDATAPIGVPIGMELLSRPFSEPELISMAYSFEQAARVRRPPAGFPDLDFSSVVSNAQHQEPSHERT